MSEATLTRQITTYLERLKRAGLPVWWLKVKGGPMQRAGVPDLLICIGGYMLAIELKSPDTMPVPSPKQARELIWLSRARARTICSNSLTEVKANIREMFGTIGIDLGRFGI